MLFFQIQRVCLDVHEIITYSPYTFGCLWKELRMQFTKTTLLDLPSLAGMNRSLITLARVFAPHMLISAEFIVMTPNFGSN